MENGVVNIARELTPRGFEFHVACLSRSGAFAERLPDPANVYPLQKPDGFSWRTVHLLRKLIREIDPAVVHTHNLGALIYASLASRFGRLRPILHGEHGTPETGPDTRRRNLQRKLFFHAAHKVHTVSHGLRRHFVDAGFPESKLIPLINGVDTRRYQPGARGDARRKLRLPPESSVLLMVGRLTASKRHLLLFEAFERVVNELPQSILVVVGDGGNDGDPIRQAARNSPVSKQIRMEGFQADLRDYYHAADLLVAPSRVEGLSNAVLEAMACGLPPLLDDACGNSEVVQDQVEGAIRNLDSPSRLADEILSLLGDPVLLQRFSSRARDRILARYSLERMANDYETTYREVAGRTS